MVPIPKTESPSSLDDTRPIALMEVALKILTKIISNRTLHAWVSNKRLESSQYAFLPGVSTADPLQIARCIFELSNTRIKQQILQSEDGEALSAAVHVAYIDIRRAYDSIEPWALALALRSLGVPAQIVTLMADIDKDCTLTVETQYGNTPDTPMGRGCKQGDPFSCLRFNAFINGLLRHLKTIPHAWRITPTTSSQGQAFADDTMLIADSHIGLQALTSATHEFLSFFSIDMAAQKSFHSSNSPDPPPAPVLWQRDHPICRGLGACKILGLPYRNRSQLATQYPTHHGPNRDGSSHSPPCKNHSIRSGHSPKCSDRR
jgi:hypothetical protein